MPTRGLFVAFEGIDGSGKSTQANRLTQHIRKTGLPALQVREPGSTPLGDHLRNYLKNKLPIDPTAELLLFASARAHLTNTVILPALAQGTHVVSDRYKASSVAYQGFGRGIPLETVHQVNAVASAGLNPDLTIWLDISPDLAARRNPPTLTETDTRPHSEARRFEDLPSHFHRRVAEGYQHQASDPGWHRLDATTHPDQLARQVSQLFNQALALT